MMENGNKDKVMGEIFAHSRMEIANPYFNDSIIKKIVQQKKRRAVVNYILACALLMIVSAVMIMLSIPAQLPATGNPVSGFNILGINIFITVINTGNWFRENLYFLLPVIMLFFFKKLVDIKFKQAHTSNK